MIWSKHPDCWSPSCLEMRGNTVFIPQAKYWEIDAGRRVSRTMAECGMAKKPTTLLFFKPIVSSVQLILKNLIENITYSSYIWSTDVLIKLHTTKYESMFTWILMPYTSYYLFITCQWWWRRIFMSIWILSLSCHCVKAEFARDI